MLKRLTIFFLIDIVAISIFIILMKADPSVSIAEVIIIPTLVAINFIVALIFLTLKNKKTAAAFFINCILTGLIFHFCFSVWFWNYNVENFDNKYFKFGDKNYQLTIYKKSDYFSLSNITTQKSGSTIGVLFGHYKKNKDTIYFTDKSKKLTLYDKFLIGFPKEYDTIVITKR